MTVVEQWAWLARIRHSQGRKGEVFAEILTDYPEKFAERKRLWLLRDSPPRGTRSPVGGNSEPAPREVELAAHWRHKGGIVLHLAGVDTISAAEELVGLVVAIPRAERMSLAEDEAYIGDLIGCTLVDLARTEPVVGQIVDVETTAGPVPLLIVQGACGEILVPFAKSYLRRLDVDGKRVEMALPDGLVELNGPEQS
jgi:16S rRNA processing protein RimM